MSSLKELKLAQKAAAAQQQILSDLDGLVKDLERSEKMIGELHQDLLAANAKYPNPRTTREDIDYLTELLKCANKKLVWEKQVASLQKRTPALLEKMSELMDDPLNPPPETTRTAILQVLQQVQAAVARLQAAKES